MRLVVHALIGALAACSPFSGAGAFHCEDHADCAGGPGAGQCQANGYCSFADDRCTSGQRYGTSSGPMSNTCVGDEPVVDAPSGADAPDGIVTDARQCFGTPLEVCLTVLPSGTRILGGTIDTNSGCDQTQPQAGGPELCIVSGAAITVGDLRATGTRPLVIVGTESIRVTGTLDLASRRQGAPGAGANAAACDGAENGENDVGGGGGGGGGGYGADGGDAGEGDSNQSGGNDGRSSGGDGGEMLVSTLVRGGCRGGRGGNGTNGAQGGEGGNGGGAAYLIAGGTIAVQGDIFAAGAGGTGGGIRAGGGGGGSGGLIGFDAATIDVTGRVVANGGGGGGGGGATQNGGNGGDGTTAQYDQRAAAGTGGTATPGGGRGGARGNPAGESSALSEGGSGGGGGGVGVIWVHGTLTGTQLSPAMTPH